MNIHDWFEKDTVEVITADEFVYKDRKGKPNHCVRLEYLPAGRTDPNHSVELLVTKAWAKALLVDLRNCLQESG